MEWIAAALVVIFLLWKFPKVTLRITAAILLLAAAIGAIAWAYSEIEARALEAEKNKINATVTLGNKCAGVVPLYVRIHNGTDGSIDEFSYVLTAKFPGRSSEVYSAYESTDLITPSGKTAVACVGLNSYSAPGGQIQGFSPAELDWSIRITNFKKSPS